MKNVFNIVKKEFDKIFKFPRMIFTTLIMPGLIIFLIYSFMGASLKSQTDQGEEAYSLAYIINGPESFQFANEIMENLKIHIIHDTKGDIEKLLDNLEEGLFDVLIVFEEDFDNKVENQFFPSVTTYYSHRMDNKNTATKVNQLMAIQYNYFLERLNINPNIIDYKYERTEGQAGAVGEILAAVLPILIMSFIFASAMGIGSDAIAGEKERGTLATLLMAPIRRNDIIVGKIISTSLITLISAMSSFLGVLASMPFAKSMFMVGEEATLNYSVFHYLGLVGILLILSMLASSLLLITSTFAKTVKEATMYSMPIYIIAILVPAMTMFSSSIDGFGAMVVPIYNLTAGFKGILSMTITLQQYITIVFSSLFYIALAMFLLMKMFRNEKVLFSK